MLFLAAIAIAVPSLFNAAIEPDVINVEWLSMTTAVVMLAIYVLSIVYMLLGRKPSPEEVEPAAPPPVRPPSPCFCGQCRRRTHTIPASPDRRGCVTATVRPWRPACQVRRPASMRLRHRARGATSRDVRYPLNCSTFALRSSFGSLSDRHLDRPAARSITLPLLMSISADRETRCC